MSHVGSEDFCHFGNILVIYRLVTLVIFHTVSLL